MFIFYPPLEEKQQERPAKTNSIPRDRAMRNAIQINFSF